ncbi:secretory phospholipase A2 receptor [Silurus meridionalis]|nr:secretory phospholipase A2 receptor [Silurus meridionalis]
MMALVFLFLLLSAFSPPVHNRFFTFHLISDSINQTAARAACRENHIDLITVYSDEDNTELYKIMRDGGRIGLIRGQFSEKWSNGDPVTFRSLAGVCGTSTCCAALKPDGSWESLQCTGTRYFMCYKEGDTETRQNYHLILENKTWYGAQRYCRSKYTDLVSIRDQQQNEEVKMKGLNSNTLFWIGLLCDDWQWTDGGNSTYRNWGSGFPYSSPSNCVMLGSGGQWHSVPCSNNFQYTLCDIHRRSTTFYLISGYMNETVGRAACRENHIDLVTVHSDGDNSDLYKIIRKADSGSRSGRIGLIRGQFSEKWSNGDPVTFRSLAGVCGTSTCCAAMKPDGSWESLQCTKTRYFMCYKEDVSSQIPNYHLILENKTWYGAQRYCRSKYTDLVSIRDQQQNEEVKMKGLNSNTLFWIGLLRDDWQWTDGGNSTYRNWRSSEPKSSANDCVSMEYGGLWHSVPCSNKYDVTLCDSK